jgi:hypothetical protein
MKTCFVNQTGMRAVLGELARVRERGDRVRRTDRLVVLRTLACHHPACETEIATQTDARISWHLVALPQAKWNFSQERYEMPTIQPERLLADLRHLRSIGAQGIGVVRPAFSAKDMEARRWLK